MPISRKERRKGRREGGIRDTVANANSMMSRANGLLALFDPDEIQDGINALEDAGPKLLNVLNCVDALIGGLTPDQIRELRAAVITKLDHDGDGDVDLDDIPWPGWLRTAWGWIKRFLPGKSKPDPSAGCETGS